MPVTVHVRLLLETMLVTGTTAVRQHNLLAAGDDLQAAVETAVHPQALYTPHGQACLTPDTQQLPFCDATLTPAARVKDLIGRLNLTEKIQLTGVVKGDLCAGLDGGVPRLGIEPVSCLIECTGAVSSSCYVDPSSGESFCPTVFPAPAAVAASFNRTLMRLRGAVTGMEARAFNNLHVDRIYGPDAHVDLLAFGPDINLIVDPRNGRNGENPSEDGYLAGAYAVEYVQGAQESPDDPSHLMLSMALKHYAGYESETNRMASNFAFSAFDLLDTFLVPYAMGFKDGRAVGSMCAYDSINNVSSCADKWLLTSMVKEYWRRNDTYTMSDCFAVDNEFTAKHRVSSYAAATAQSVKAGTDWCMGKAYVESNGIADAIKQGLMTEEDVNIALSRTLSVRMRLGMFDSTPTSASAFRRYGKEYINTAASKQAAEEAAAQGAVLLRNEDNALPLNPSTLPSIAIVGPHAVSQRALLGDFYADAFCPGNSTPGQRAEQCVPTVGSSITALLRGHGAAAVRVEAGVPIMGTNETGIAAAVAAVQASTTAILALGYSNKDVEREGADHNFTTLPTGQLALANAVIAAAEAQNSTVVMLLINAGQIATDNLAKQPAAVIECFYPAFGAPALARQIFGLENRWGRLPYTIYDSGFADAIKLSDMSVSGSVGRTWRYYTGSPNYAFGRGLSYSHFSLGCTGAIDPANPVAGGNFSVQVGCQSELTSGMAHGDEILLVRHRVGADVVAAIGAEHPVPKGTLREFSRLSLSHGGQPGHSSFQLGVDSFALTDNAGRSILYPGTHYIDVSPREPGNAWSLTVTVGGKAKAILATPPPLPKST